LLNKDSRDTNPDGTFDFVVSSFADHHIHALDKKTYFQNVKRNLRASAMFVVGDEFLPEYDIADEAARRQALNTYHDHIVQQAQAAGHVELVELEEQARRSGLASKGDYKLSLGHYGKLLQEAGLKVRERTKIGPLDPQFEGVGGIYVYEITPS
jgi:hypothetical protein